MERHGADLAPVMRFATLAALVLAASTAAASARELRVCADPNNLPFSNAREEGFENALARLVARDLGARLTYFWWAQRRGFARNTLKANECDVVMGVPTGYEMAATTRPYYRSTYVFVTRRGTTPAIRSLDDDALRRVRIGFHVIGEDYANPPPVTALVRRGITSNLHGYSIYGDYSKPDPPAALIHAVARGDVDVAIAWGPIAGFFAGRETTPLEIVPVSPQIDVPFLPFVFDIAMGVRRDDHELRERLDDFIGGHEADIRALLGRYHVPVVGDAGRP